MLPLSLWLLVAALALMAGVAGGVGGRAIFLNLRFYDVHQRIDALELRLSRREGSAGRAKVDANKNAEQEMLLQLLAQSKGNHREEMDFDNMSDSQRATMVAQARATFAEQDKKGGKK